MWREGEGSRCELKFILQSSSSPQQTLASSWNFVSECITTYAPQRTRYILVVNKATLSTTNLRIPQRRRSNHCKSDWKIAPQSHSGSCSLTPTISRYVGRVDECRRRMLSWLRRRSVSICLAV